MTDTQLALFAAAWAAGIYTFNSLIARKFKAIKVQPAFLYVATLAMLGVYGETVFGNLYRHLFGRPLWHYTVLPIHQAYTSEFALFLWGLYGFHLYLMHDNLLKRNTDMSKYLPYIFCLEAILIEAAVNLSFRVVFNRYFFYYFPSDLWHLTSVQTLPIYLAGGFAISAALKKTRSEPVFFGFAATAFAVVLVFLA